MVNNSNTQIDHLFQELISLLSAESKVEPYTGQFLKYVHEKYDFVKQTADEDQIKESVRGINRYYDEFSFSDTNAKKIKVLIENLYDLVNHL